MSEGQFALVRLLTIPVSDDLKTWLAELHKPWPVVEWIETTPEAAQFKREWP